MLADSIQRELQAQIDAGRWQPGQRLGSERSLAAELGVSRSSLRQALAMMEQAGAVRRVIGRGGGTFVSHQKIDRDLSHIRSVPELLSAQGITAGTRILSTGTAPAAAATSEALELEPGQLVYAIVRIRLADGAPISLEHAWLPVVLFPGLLDFQLGGSLYGILDENFSIQPQETTERIEVLRATPDDASILGIERGDPLLSITRVTRSADGTPFEHSHDLFRADRTRIVVHTVEEGDDTTTDLTRQSFELITH
ncbi:MAG TPA: GntR family transcriptional regulator [Nocardioides sp.]|jgi:GntR family transcriptional regulator|nr:GntR family transcriptional regulator [Nocardioides sp.]